MNIQEAEEHLNAVLFHIDLNKDRIQKLVNEQAKSYAKQKSYEATIEELKQEAAHWTNVISMMKLKDSIPVVNY